VALNTIDILISLHIEVEIKINRFSICCHYLFNYISVRKVYNVL